MAQTVIINGVTYSSVPSVTIPKSGGGDATFWDTTEATVSASDILSGQTAFGASGSVTGTMANNGALSGTIATKDGTYSILAGYTSGGSVALDDAQKALLVSGNIKSGVTLFGVAGSSSVVDTSDATATAATILNGVTAYVNGSKITGSLNTPVISQDSTTKVLSIS